MIWFLPELGLVAAADKMSMGFYLLTFGFFILFLFISSLKPIKVLQLLFALVTALFFLLAIADLTGITQLTTIGGYLGIVLGAG